MLSNGLIDSIKNYDQNIFLINRLFRFTRLKFTLKIIVCLMVANILISISILKQQTSINFFSKENFQELDYIYDENDLLNYIKSLRLFYKINNKRKKNFDAVTRNIQSDFMLDRNVLNDLKANNLRQKKFYEPEILINEPKKCVKNENTILIICLIHSHKNNFLRRKAMRDTWLTMNKIPLVDLTNSNDNYKFKYVEIKHVFLIGSSESNETNQNIQAESNMYNDIIMIDTIDSYKNLLYKHLTVIKWVIKYCEKAMFVMKLDDDVFVNIKSLSKHLIEKIGTNQTKTNFIYCNINEMASPIRKNASKWYVNTDTYPFAIYPRYCEGFAYITNVATIRIINEQSNMIPRFWIDDVYFTGFLFHGLESVKWFDFKNNLKWSYYDFWDLGNSFKIYELYAKFLKFFKINPIDYYLSDSFVILHSQLNNKEINYNLINLDNGLVSNRTDNQSDTNLNHFNLCNSNNLVDINVNFNCTIFLDSAHDNKTDLYVNFYNFCINLWKKSIS